MKSHRSFYVMLVMACVSAQAICSGVKDSCHIFRSTDGRCISGTLMNYNPDGRIATIAREDGKEFQVGLELFIEADQDYIREQGPVRDFLHSFRIVPVLRSFDAAGSYDNTRYKSEHVKALGYVIDLTNASPTRFREIEIEYCLFYWQGERREAGMEYRHGVQYGRWELDTLVPGSGDVVETDPILLYNTGSTSTLFGHNIRAQGGVDGIWLRIAATLSNGDRLIRELRTSPLNGRYHNWVTTAIPVGLNKPQRSIALF